MVLNVLRNTINLIFALVHDDPWVRAGDAVDLSLRSLLLKDWPFSDHYGDFACRSRGVVLLPRNYARLVALHKQLEVNIASNAISLVFDLPLAFDAFALFHLLAPLLALYAQFFDFFNCAFFLLERRCGTARTRNAVVLFKSLFLFVEGTEGGQLALLQFLNDSFGVVAIDRGFLLGSLPVAM